MFSSQRHSTSAKKTLWVELDKWKALQNVCIGFGQVEEESWGRTGQDWPVCDTWGRTPLRLGATDVTASLILLHGHTYGKVETCAMTPPVDWNTHTQWQKGNVAHYVLCENLKVSLRIFSWSATNGSVRFALSILRYQHSSWDMKYLAAMATYFDLKGMVFVWEPIAPLLRKSDWSLKHTQSCFSWNNLNLQSGKLHQSRLGWWEQQG